MERGPDGDELEHLIGIDIFGASCCPPHVAYSPIRRFARSEVDRFGLLIDGPYLAEVISEGERQRAWTARQVEQAAGATHRRPATHVLDENSRIRQPELVVERRRPSAQVTPKRRTATHSRSASQIRHFAD